MYLRSLFFKNLDFEMENDMYSSHKGLSIDDDDIEKSASRVIEEEALRYIGGYIVRKFSKKYPHLGSRVKNNITKDHSWTEMVSRGELHVPSNEFLYQLTVLRQVLNAIHGQILLEGKDCLKTLIAEQKKPGVSIPEDVLALFD